MGSFLVRHVDLKSGAELSRFSVPNFLTYENIHTVYNQMFPRYQGIMAFKIGLAGPNTVYPETRPNPGTGVLVDPHLTLAQCTDQFANEGGCHTSGMRASFGYAQRTVTFSADMEADGGGLVSQRAVFSNDHSWTPQNGGDWDLPWTTHPGLPGGPVEQPPPEWEPNLSWESEVGYPWQIPRKRDITECNPDPPNECVYSYMYQWDNSGALDWLYDFRRMGGFPITMVFLVDSNRNKLIAAAHFRIPVLLRPGTTLYVHYQARLFGSKYVSRDFLHRYAGVAYAHTSPRYWSWGCRPVLATMPEPTRRTTYSDVEPYFLPQFPHAGIRGWTFVPYSAGPPEVLPYMKTANIEWRNISGSSQEFGYLAVYGSTPSNELAWLTKIDPSVIVPVNDFLRIPDGVRFWLLGV